MKKLKYLVVLLLGIVVITGCESNDKEKTMVCTRTINQDSISMDLKYTVTYKGEYVQQIESVEKVKTSDPTTLTTFKDTIEATYKPYLDIKYYDFNVTVEDDTLTSTVKIDYSKIDTKKLVEIDSANSQLFTDDGKAKLETIKATYKASGDTCTEE